MANFQLLKTIGMAFFFVKFYIFIGWLYVYNFFAHIWERIKHGNSKRVVCPYKKTHEHVFITICTSLSYLEELIALDGFTITQYEFETPDKAFVSFWRVQTKDLSIPKQKYPVLLLHGLLDCSVSWFFHTDKFNLNYLDLKLYLISQHQRGMTYGLEIIVEQSIQIKILICLIIGNTISITLLNSTNQL